MFPPKVHDSVVDTIPQFDLILTRHTMMHLKLKDGVAMLMNFYNSGSHFLLATNFPEIKARNKTNNLRSIFRIRNHFEFIIDF